MNNFAFDYWTLVGIAAQAMFFSRFILQWYQSEKTGKITVPVAFWVLSLIGSCLLLLYAIVRRDFVFTVTAILQLGLFSRSLILARRIQND